MSDSCVTVVTTVKGSVGQRVANCGDPGSTHCPAASTDTGRRRLVAPRTGWTLAMDNFAEDNRPYCSYCMSPIATVQAMWGRSANMAVADMWVVWKCSDLMAMHAGWEHRRRTLSDRAAPNDKGASCDADDDNCHFRTCPRTGDPRSNSCPSVRRHPRGAPSRNTHSGSNCVGWNFASPFCCVRRMEILMWCKRKFRTRWHVSLATIVSPWLLVPHTNRAVCPDYSNWLVNWSSKRWMMTVGAVGNGLNVCSVPCWALHSIPTMCVNCCYFHSVLSCLWSIYDWMLIWAL